MILFISVIFACSLSISFICERGVLLIIILIGNFLFFLLVFNVIDILYHLFSSIFPKFTWLLYLLSLKKRNKFILASIFNNNLFPLLKVILNIVLYIYLLIFLLAILSILVYIGFKMQLKLVEIVIPSFNLVLSLLVIVGAILMFSFPLKK